MVRTQSIVSVGKFTNDGAATPANDKSPVHLKAPTSSVRRRRSGKEKATASATASTCVEGMAMTADTCDGGHNGAAVDGMARLQEIIQPLEVQQLTINERLAKLEHKLDLLLIQQRDREVTSNINRESLLLTLASAMVIVAFLYWILSRYANPIYGS